MKNTDLLAMPPRRSPLVRAQDYYGLKSRFLKGLSPRIRDTVLSAAVEKRLPAEVVLTNQEDPAEYLFLLLSGSARHYFTTVDGGKQLLLWLRPGDIVGGMTLLPDRAAYLVSTELLSNSILAMWGRDEIRRLAEEYPLLLDNGLGIASDYLTWYVASHAALRCRDARRRLYYVLTSLATGFGEETPDGIELSITNEELANAAGVSSFTVSRLVSSWQRNGAVSKARGKLILRDVSRL